MIQLIFVLLMELRQVREVCILVPIECNRRDTPSEQKMAGKAVLPDPSVMQDIRPTTHLAVDLYECFDLHFFSHVLLLWNMATHQEHFVRYAVCVLAYQRTVLQIVYRSQ